MPRPRLCRLVADTPPVDYYKPRGVPLAQLREVVLPLEGLEALRLVEVEGLDQEAAAARMGVSRPTFTRVLAEARHLVAVALTQGQALRIAGGDYRLAEAPAGQPDAPCLGRMGHGRGGFGGGGHGRGRGRGRDWPA
ncbi:MAG: DUF134 domain-containing protein [Pseudomonadota bacterium]